MNLHQADCIYAAGYFEGEGFATISKVKNRDGELGWYYVFTGVANTELDALQFFKTTFGGSISIDNNRTGKAKPLHRWVIASKSAGVFLRSILPYLKVERKRRTVEIALELQSIVEQPRADRKSKLSKDELEVRERLFQEMKLYNKRGLD